jgi:uncharacterized membrane protein (DUF2068 family)
MIEGSEEQGKNSEPAASAVEAPLLAKEKVEPRARGLLAIGVFKLLKAVFFIAVGFGALHLVHRNLGEVFLKVASALHLAPEGRFVGMLQDKIDLIDGHQLRRLSQGTFLYAALCLIEGVGLITEQTWAEYLTLTLTIGALPWDVWELIKQPTSIRIGVVAINVVVLAYLLWFIRMHRRDQRARAAGDAMPDPRKPGCEV